MKPKSTHNNLVTTIPYNNGVHHRSPTYNVQMSIPAAANETADLAREKHSLARQAGTSTCVKNIAY